MKKILLVSLTMIFCFCGRKGADEENSVNVLKIDLLSEPLSEIKNLSELASDIRYVPLQTTENSLMSGFSRKVVKAGDRFYIHCRQEILCFDSGGKFLFKLSNEGRGPQEYNFIDDFDISTDSRFLAVLSHSTILMFSISEEGFDYKSAVKLKEPMPFRMGIVPESHNMFLAVAPWSGTEPSLSLLVGPGGDTISFKPNFYKYTMNRTSNYQAINEMVVYSAGREVCFKEEFSDTVFSIDAKNNSFKPRIIFDSHGTLITAEMRGGNESYGTNTNYIANVFETPRYVFYWHGTKEKHNRILFDKSTGTKSKLDMDNEAKSYVKEDIGGGPNFNVDFLNYYCSGGQLFSFVEAITLKKYVESDDFRNAKVSDEHRKDDLKRTANSLKETDNPVLVVVSPRD